MLPVRRQEGVKALEINTPELETSRLILRKFTEDDIDALLAIYSDRDVNTFLPWFPIQTRDEAKFLRRSMPRAMRALPDTSMPFV